MEFDKNNILSNITLLFVEDEELARVELSRFLKKRLGRLIVGKDGEEGLELIKKFNPDIVVTDIKLPSKTGIEMLKEAKESGYKGGIVVLSALSDTDTILNAIDTGIIKYMVKPIDTDLLTKSLEEISVEMIKRRTGKSIIGEKYILDKEEKKELEDEVKSKTAFFIKKHTGKGPKNVRVFIQGQDINIEAEEVLTVLEQSLLKDKKNISLVEYNRKAFYDAMKEELEGTIGEVIGKIVKFESIDFNYRKNTDFIKLSFQ